MVCGIHGRHGWGEVQLGQQREQRRSAGSLLCLPAGMTCGGAWGGHLNWGLEHSDKWGRAGGRWSVGSTGSMEKGKGDRSWGSLAALGSSLRG